MGCGSSAAVNPMTSLAFQTLLAVLLVAFSAIVVLTANTASNHTDPFEKFTDEQRLSHAEHADPRDPAAARAAIKNLIELMGADVSLADEFKNRYMV